MGWVRLVLVVVEAIVTVVVSVAVIVVESFGPNFGRYTHTQWFIYYIVVRYHTYIPISIHILHPYYLPYAFSNEFSKVVFYKDGYKEIIFHLYYIPL